ncbi:CLUMA_CG014385, isoform A [Clunio marinus]|uniref:CLUMA_CG014385, isoform A n=1 Tax=Clunio marinus TaxID=568069 RepID=A0A1J1IL30_9DIPT|nr:CLUMA_CG014385, isoform A [Clunio marinus]
MDHNFILWEQSDEPNYDEIIENENDIEELNDIMEEQVEGYEEVNMLEETSETDEAYYIDEGMISVPQENLIYLDDSIVNGTSRIGVGMSHLIEQRVEEAENKIIGDQDDQEYTATVEEVITEEWPLEGEDMVQVAMEQVVTSDNFQEDDIETVPLHTDQDEYTTSRPYPCDFCSRRFRKKANLMNHMVAHQNVRPHMCNLCGSRYVRKCDLINHLKIHAYNIEDESSGPSTGGKKKPPKFDELNFLDESFDDLPDDNDFDYNHYSKPTSTTVQMQQSKASKMSAKKKVGKKTTTNKSTAMKFEKLSKKKELSKEVNITIEDIENNKIEQQDNMQQQLCNEYVEKYPITDPRKPFVCQHCGVAFTREKALESHTKLHATQESTFDCEVCDEEGNRPLTTDGTSLGCNVCGESFTEALDLLAHAEIHARFQPFKCQLCGDTFFEENKIKIHLMDNHQNELTESSCRLCGKQCRDQRSLIKHSWEHSREKNHPCSKCGKTFHNKARLKRHISSHRNKSVICEICHEEFPDGRQLMNHRHSHTKANQFPCHECGKTFGSRSSQQIHIRIHTGERPYGCRFCWKAFADGGTLRKHERIHTGEKPYCCLVCPRAFNQRVVLREHIRSHHSAPDPVNGTTLTPYFCSLCGDLFAVSLDLIHHLIEHSDRSTAAKRVQPAGPRKYKRRRKLNGDSDNSENVTNVESKMNFQRPLKNTITKQTNESDLKNNLLSAFPISKDVNKFDEFKLPDEIFQAVGQKIPSTIGKKDVGGMKQNLRASTSAGSRPRMIYTQKTKLTATDGKRKKKGMIQKQVLQPKMKPIRASRQVKQEKLDEETFEHDESSETWSNDDPNEDVLDTLLKRERKLSEKFTIDLVNDLQEILRSPLKLSEDKHQSMVEEDEDKTFATNRRSCRQVKSRYGSAVRKHPMKNTNKRRISSPSETSEDENDDDMEKYFIKQELPDESISCGICGDSFMTQTQLLNHVSIHI